MIRVKEQEIVEEFSMFEDWMDKYEYLISMAKELPMMDEKLKVEENLVRGCQSKVWLSAQFENGKIIYAADSDAIISKGIVALLVRVLNHETPDEVLNATMDFVDTIGLKEHLSPNRSNGLAAMFKEMKTYALAFKAKNNLATN